MLGHRNKRIYLPNRVHTSKILSYLDSAHEQPGRLESSDYERPSRVPAMCKQACACLQSNVLNENESYVSNGYVPIRSVCFGFNGALNFRLQTLSAKLFFEFLSFIMLFKSFSRLLINVHHT